MAIKIEPETLRSLSDQKMLGQHTPRILFYMMGVMDHNNVAKISQQKLAERIGTSGQTVYASTKWLVECGFIAKVKDGKRQKSFIVSPALAMHERSTFEHEHSDYEAIMAAFTEAQGVTDSDGIEDEEISGGAEVEVPEFVGIPEAQ